MSRNIRALLLAVILLVSILSVYSLIFIVNLTTHNPEQGELEAIWERVRQSGGYNFSAEVVQRQIPLAKGGQYRPPEPPGPVARRRAYKPV